MFVQRSDTFALPPVVRKLLAADAAVEAVVGLLLLGIVGRPARWLDLPEGVLLVAASVFFVAAIALAAAALSRSTSLSFVRQLAWANMAGGAVLWVWIAFSWGTFEPEGTSLAILAADSFILLGVLEWLAVRKAGASA
jgi:hypothetical protein